MIRSLVRNIKHNSQKLGNRHAYAQYSAVQRRKGNEPLSYRQWREAMLKNSLPKE